MTQPAMPGHGTRDEHLAWCKEHALQYVDAGDVHGAFAVMAADLQTHPETENHAAMKIGTLLLLGGHLDSAVAMRKFIEGFR